MTIAITGLIYCLGNYPSLAAEKLPDGWFKAGSNPQDYEVNIDKKNIYNTDETGLFF